MIISGLKLMLLGMFFVFLFLVLMWVVIKVFSSIFKRHALLEEKMQKDQAIPRKNTSRALPVAAISTAIHFFRRNSKLNKLLNLNSVSLCSVENL